MVEKTKGALFLEKNGYSKTMARLMNKYGCIGLEDYRRIRKATKKKQQEASKAKNERARLGKRLRIVNSKPKVKK